MNDKDLMKLSFAIAVLGIIALFLVTEQLEPIAVPVELIDSSYVGKNVVVNSTIKSLTIKDDNIFITLNEGMRVVVFKNKALDDNYNLKAGNKISVVGKVQLYKNELEIIAEKITKL